jgi:hypothetical protein
MTIWMTICPLFQTDCFHHPTLEKVMERRFLENWFIKDFLQNVLPNWNAHLY